MATEEQKKKNMMRLMTLMIAGMAKALYDLFGETAFATMSEVGKSTLEIMELQGCRPDQRPVPSNKKGGPFMA
ncbi:MAG: hypothetical protein D3909_01505, partial [Candidatus Electrothrix sp. ATG1]|nr:hypothetical protein [Candidatus Electrothrix sp. ATG1]